MPKQPEPGRPDHRSRICLIVILIGLANFLAYSIGYLVIGGEAIHGLVKHAGGGVLYYLAGRPDEPVSRAVFVYSAIHSTSIWVTFAAVMLAMLTLAKDRIVLSMRKAVLRGRAVITIVAVIIAIVAILLTYRFTRRFVRQMRSAATPAARIIGDK